MKKVFLLFAAWLIIANLFALGAANRVNLRSDTAYPWIDPAKTAQTQTWNPVPLHARWDSNWHMGIARDGYVFQGYDQLSNVVFLPLYALTMRAAAPLLGDDYALAGWILSCVFLLLALIYLYKLIREFHPDINPYLAAIFLLIFPTAFFLNAVYTESLFLFLSVAAFYYAFRKKFLLAGVLGLLAALTRITGVLLFLPLIWEYYRAYGRELKPSKLLPIFLVPLGTLGFFLFHYLKFGDFLLFFKIESSWGRAFSLNRDHLVLLTHPAAINLLLDLGFVILALVATFFAFKKLRASYGIYMLATLLVALGTGTMMSIGRYIIVLFPIFLLAASIKNETLKMTYSFASILLFALYTLLFVNWYWAG